MRAFPIRNDADLERAFALIEDLWEAEQGTPEGDLLEVMSTLVDSYEAARSALPEANPIELIEFKLRELGWSQRELARRLGCGGGRVSELLSGKRQLTLALVRQISAVLDIPAGLLVHDDAAENSAGVVREGPSMQNATDDVSFTASSAAAPSGSVIGSAAHVRPGTPELRLVRGGRERSA